MLKKAQKFFNILKKFFYALKRRVFRHQRGWVISYKTLETVVVS
jgi:hypothetical protein